MSKASLWDVDWDKVIEERFGVDVQTLFRYAEAHKRGIDCDFPCKPGDTLYVIGDIYKDYTEGIWEYTCSCIDVVEKGGYFTPVAMTYRVVGNSIKSAAFTKEQFGETVFCHQSEAKLVFNDRKEEIEDKLKIVNNIFRNRPFKSPRYN